MCATRERGRVRGPPRDWATRRGHATRPRGSADLELDGAAADVRRWARALCVAGTGGGRRSIHSLPSRLVTMGRVQKQRARGAGYGLGPFWFRRLHVATDNMAVRGALGGAPGAQGARATAWWAQPGGHSLVGTAWWAQPGGHSLVGTAWWATPGGACGGRASSAIDETVRWKKSNAVPIPSTHEEG